MKLANFPCKTLGCNKNISDLEDSINKLFSCFCMSIFYHFFLSSSLPPKKKKIVLIPVKCVHLFVYESYYLTKPKITLQKKPNCLQIQFLTFIVLSFMNTFLTDFHY